MNMRESFEKHIRDNYSIALEYGHLSLERDTDDSYVHGETNGWWMIWQASRAAIVLPFSPYLRIDWVNSTQENMYTESMVKQAIGAG